MILGVCRRCTISFHRFPGRPPLSNKNININNNWKQIHTHCSIILLSPSTRIPPSNATKWHLQIKCNGSSENAPIYPIYMVTSRHTVALAVAYYVRTTLSIPTDHSVSFQFHFHIIILFCCLVVDNNACIVFIIFYWYCSVVRTGDSPQSSFGYTNICIAPLHTLDIFLHNTNEKHGTTDGVLRKSPIASNSFDKWQTNRTIYRFYVI